MTKKLTYLLITVTFALQALCSQAQTMGAGDWKLHATFPHAAYFKSVIDTSDRVFMQVMGQGNWAGAVGFETPFPQLFVYDKEADEMLAYNKRNYLNGNIVMFMDYNPVKKYLLLVYDDGNIDLLYDDDHVVNIPGLKSVQLASTKNVNAVSFDPDNDRAYLATDFGYLEIDDKKGVIADSRIYNTKLTGAFRMGDNFMVSADEKLLCAPIADRRQQLADYTPINGAASVKTAYPLTGDKILLNMYNNSIVYVSDIKDGTVKSFNRISESPYLTIRHNKNGYVMTTEAEVCQIAKDGTVTKSAIPAGLEKNYFGSWDMTGFWHLAAKKGLASHNKDWALTHDYIHPNAPSTFVSDYMAYSPKYGMLAVNHGVTSTFTTDWISAANLLNGYKDGQWTHLSPMYRDTSYLDTAKDPDGLAIDPDNPDLVYFGSRNYGLTRYNMADPSDVRIYGRTGQANASLPGFTSILPKEWAYFGAPSFDADGNLWTFIMRPPAGKYQLMVWPSADRKADRPSGFTSIPTEGFNIDWMGKIMPMKHPANKNLVVMYDGKWGGSIAVIDHNGTLDNPNDDKIAAVQTLYDTAGTELTKTYILEIFEDQKTGQVWVGSTDGLFLLNPRKFVDGDHIVSRIKVARNDGTNLADYLLDGVGVSRIATDSQNRKWIATRGGGLVWTSSDGQDVLGQFTTENSYLPNDEVYSVGYKADSNSVLVSTLHGVAEYFLPGAASSDDGIQELHIYPNPVRPDYLGWVTIDGLTDGAVVKITDAAGNLVRELGSAENGVAQWDCMTADHRRVTTGVYYVVASEGASGGNSARLGKILVVN